MYRLSYQQRCITRATNGRRRPLRSSAVPIVLLGRHRTHIDKIRALDAGADEYVVKPFAMDELMARIRAILRRLPPSTTMPCFADGSLLIDCRSRKCTLKGQYVRLTPKEFEVLRLLLVNRNRPRGNSQIVNAVWGDHC